MVRMRTINGTLEYLKEIDPQTAISSWNLRNLIKSGKLKCHKAGNRYLINLDNLENYLNNPELENFKEKDVAEYGKIRKA